MLDLLRKNSRHWLVVGLMALVVVGLSAFFGASSRNANSGQTWAAKIDGDTIKMGEYITRYRNVVEMYRRKIGPDFNEKLLQQLNIKFQILSSMVMDRILFNESKKNGLDVSSDELRDSIAEIQYFQKDGKFNMDYYKGMLSYNKMTANEFENIQRKELLREKARQFVMASSKVSDEELKYAYIVDNQKVKLAYIKINNILSVASDIKKEEINAFLASEQGKKETQDYYTKHNDDFVDSKSKNKAVLKFEDVKEGIAKNILSNKKEKDALVTKINEAMKTENIDKASKILESKVETTDLFSRKNTSIPAISGSNTNDVLWAFGIGSKLVKRDIAGKTYLVVIKGVETAKTGIPEKDHDSFKNNLLSERGNAEFLSYLEELKKRWSKKVVYSPVLLRDIRNGEQD
ncbi:MAG: SurA N-terminal domain-containing protein [bacterium]